MPRHADVTFEVVAISTRCGMQDVVSPWTRVRFWERLCAPGRNLPRSLRTSPLPIPNFGANGRGERPSAPDAMAKPADAAAEAIDAVRAVADASVHAVVDAGPTPSSRGTFDELLRHAS